MGEPPHVHERERNALLAPAADQLTCPQRSPAQPGWHSQPPETQYPLKPAQSAAVEQAAGISVEMGGTCDDNEGRNDGNAAASSSTTLVVPWRLSAGGQSKLATAAKNNDTRKNMP